MLINFETAKQGLKQTPQQKYEQAMDQLTDILKDLPEAKRIQLAVCISKVIQAVKDGAE